MQSDVLESIDRSPNERHSFNPDPLHKYLAPSKVKKSETPSTFQQAVLLRSNYDKSLKFLKVVLVVLLASMLLLYILNRPQKQFIDEEIENVETKEEKYEKYEERFVENNIINEEILPIIRDVKDDSSSYHFQWLSLENLRKQTNLDDYLDEKIHNEFKASKLEKEIENTLHLYYNILNTTEGLQWNFNSPKIEELERKIESFLISKKNLTQIYEKGFNLTDEIIKSIQEYSTCKTGIFYEKDRLTNISLENERYKMQIKRYQGELEEIDRILLSQKTDTQSFLNDYEKAKKILINQRNEKNKELNLFRIKPDKVEIELDEIRRNLLEFNNKDKFQREIKDNSEEIERIKRRLLDIDNEKDDISQNIDFLNKRLKSNDNIARVGENFKSFSSSDAPKILLEKLKKMQIEYKDSPHNRKKLKGRMLDTKREFIDEMYSFINGKKHLSKLEDSSGLSINSEKRESYKKDLKKLDREHKDLYNRLLYLEKNIETLRKVIGEWEKKSDDAKKLQLDKESQLRECANNIRRLENEIDDLNKLIDEKEGLIDQLKSQPTFDPTKIKDNKRNLEEKIRVLKKNTNQKDNEFIATMKGINNQIKDCRKIYTNTHHLMERNKIMEDFKDYLDKLLIQKEDLRSKMKNFVEKL